MPGLKHPRRIGASLSWPRRARSCQDLGREVLARSCQDLGREAAGLRSVGRSIQHLLAMESAVEQRRGIAEAIGLM